MTDKQIIIDGVEVNECAYFLYPLGCNSLDSKTCQCINDDCYYKQLKAKERECERLKEERDTWHYQWKKQYEICESLSDDIDKLCGQLDQLKAENEDLKQFLSEEPLAIQALQSAYSDYKKRSEVFFEMIGENKQTLTEIKEITEHCMKQDICTICDYSDKCHIEDEGIPTYDVCKLILQKINEVENDRT